MKVTLVLHEGRQEVVAFGHRFVEVAGRRGIEVTSDPAGSPEVVVAIGGDGTMLAAVQVALDHDVPVLGFNMGTIGFLTEADPRQLDEVVAVLAERQVQVVPRMGVTATAAGASATGLNDVVVEKVDSLRLVHLAVEVDEEPFVVYRADGLIIATPTGSTAYNFSAGGPVVDPGIEALLLTPVASHSLFTRTVVLSPDVTIRVTVQRERPVRASVDKVKLGEMGEGSTVEIVRSARPIRFLRLDHLSFPRAVTEKLQLH